MTKVDFSKVKGQRHKNGRYAIGVDADGGYIEIDRELVSEFVTINDPDDWDKLAEAAKSIADAMREATPKSDDLFQNETTR